jgi:YfiR/HmsC-like
MHPDKYDRNRQAKVAPKAIRGSRFGPLLALLVLAHLVIAPRVQTQDSPSEYQVKAAYLFNFLKFVEWPEEAFPDPLAPIVIGIAGDDPFGSALPQVVVGKTVQGRDLVIRKYRAGEDLRSSHILFISGSEKKKVPQIVASLRGSSVLTVADFTEFLGDGGMIQLYSENNRIRFAINVDATGRAKLKISSKLLSLARVVGGSGKEGGS